ncbi:MAG: radical SAM peptide maturase [Bacteroidales bacterium]|nr:radical SAM peptide maturase [Bacteroidales bacterium]
MKQAVFFTTAKGNHYFYSPFRKQFILCHPLIDFFYHLEQKKISVVTWMQSLDPTLPLTLDNGLSFTPDSIHDQVIKYKFYKRSGYFKSVNSLNFNGKILPSTIEKNIGSIQQVIFEVTESCNFACSYCTYSKFYNNKPRGNKTFRFEDAKKILETILSKREKKKKDVLIVSFYGGEPLKNFSFIKQTVEYLKSYSSNQTTFRFNMTTNGLLLKRYIPFLVEHSFDISISLDGDEIANSFRKLKNHNPSFPIIHQIIDDIRKTYPVFFDKKVSFLSVMHNKNNPASAYRFFHNEYNKSTATSDINTQNIAEAYKQEFYDTFLADPVRDPAEKKTMKTLLLKHPKVKELSYMAEKYSGVLFEDYYQLMKNHSNGKATKSYIPTATCSPFSLRTYFTADGSILPCEHINRIFEIGTWAKGEMRIDITGIANQYNHYYQKIRKYCEQCYMAENCKECIFHTGIENEHPQCELFMNKHKFEQYLSGNFSTIENDYALFLRITDHAFKE